MLASEVGGFETHGTGTALGDPVEVGAVRAVHGTSDGWRTPMLLGALKTNLGHALAPSGLLGLAKCAAM